MSNVITTVTTINRTNLKPLKLKSKRNTDGPLYLYNWVITNYNLPMSNNL